MGQRLWTSRRRAMATGIVCVIKLILISFLQQWNDSYTLKRAIPWKQAIRFVETNLWKKMYLNSFWKTYYMLRNFQFKKPCNYCPIISHRADRKSYTCKKWLSSRHYLKGKKWKIMKQRKWWYSFWDWHPSWVFVCEPGIYAWYVHSRGIHPIQSVVPIQLLDK